MKGYIVRYSVWCKDNNTVVKSGYLGRDGTAPNEKWVFDAVQGALMDKDFKLKGKSFFIRYTLYGGIESLDIHFEKKKKFELVLGGEE